MTKEVKIFDNVTGNTEKDCNDYLKKLDTKVLNQIEIQTHYNTILGGIIFVIIHPLVEITEKL